MCMRRKKDGNVANRVSSGGDIFIKILVCSSDGHQLDPESTATSKYLILDFQGFLFVD